MNKNKPLTKTMNMIYNYMSRHGGITQAEAFL